MTMLPDEKAGVTKEGDVFTVALASHGAVAISPCISDGEREIAREAMERALPLAALRNKGFSRLGKPLGRCFDACAAGRLLMMAPAAWPYATQEKQMTRFDATALNRLAQWLAGVGAAQVNYHGMTPLNIDSLALNAALCTASGSVVGGSVARHSCRARSGIQRMKE